MKHLIMSLGVLLISAGLVSAGTNPNVVLMVHGNIDGVDTGGDVFANIPIPSNASEFSAEATPDSYGCEWFIILAVSPPENSPGFSTLCFGIEEMDTDLAHIKYWGPIAPAEFYPPLEISRPGWPNGSNQGTSFSWAPSCFDTYIQPVYYFGVYASEASHIVVGSDPVQGQDIVECYQIPWSEIDKDHIIATPVIGVGGAQGANPPSPGLQPGLGACCSGPQCVMLLEDECAEQGGVWFGGECGPNDEPCEEHVPTQLSTWGRIKATYR